MNELFKKDLYRCYGSEKETFVQWLRRSRELRFIETLRHAQSAKNLITRKYWAHRLKRISERSMIHIPVDAKIGEGFYIGHAGHIIINPAVQIGRNVNIASGVLIGRENRGKRKGVPCIGDQVWIGANSVIVGNIRIGSDVLIAPLSYVNFDVPDHSIVMGNPAKIIEREHATEGYINNMV